MLVDAPVPLPPIIELAGGNARPMDNPSDTDLSPSPTSAGADLYRTHGPEEGKAV